MNSGETIVLLKNISIQKEDINKNGSFSGFSFAYYILSFSGILDGNGHSLTADLDITYGDFETPFIFGQFAGTMKNLNINIVGNGKLCLRCVGVDTVFNSVNLSGDDFVFGNNDAAYVIYDYASKLTFKDCNFYGKIKGNGTAASYAAIYVGYCFDDPIYFINCHNKGSIILGKAVMFVGNVLNSVNANITIENCSNDGIVHWVNVSNSLGASGWYNQVLAGSAQCIGSVTLDGVTYKGREAIAGLTIPTTGDGQNLWGPQDPNLKLEKNEDGTFKITPSTNETVSYYEVLIGVYGTSSNGSLLYTVKERIEKDRFTAGYATSILRDIPFVDSKWVGSHSNADLTTIAGNTAYTYESNTYYYYGDTDYNLGTSGVKNGSIYGVSAYDASNKVIASASLSK